MTNMRSSPSTPSLSIVLVLSLIVAAAASVAAADTTPAAWTAVNVNDKSIQQVGQSAVRIYGLSTGKTYLRFVNVVSGQTQPYNGGSNYQLVITVAGPGTTTARYSVSMWGILGTTNWKLWSFTPAN